MPSSSMIHFLLWPRFHQLLIAKPSSPGLTCMQPRARPQRFRPGKIWARLCHLANWTPMAGHLGHLGHLGHWVVKNTILLAWAWWQFFQLFLTLSAEIVRPNYSRWCHIPICNGLISRLRDDLDQIVFEHDMKREGRQKDTSTILHKRGLQLNLIKFGSSSCIQPCCLLAWLTRFLGTTQRRR